MTLIQFYYGKVFPLAAAYLTHGLEKEKIPFEIKFINAYSHQEIIADILYLYMRNSADIIAIGCFSDMLPHVLTTAKRIKQLFPEKIIILGGIGPTAVAEDILDGFDGIDFIIKGCGISTLPQLIRKIETKPLVFGGISRLVEEEGKTNPKIPAYRRIKDVLSFHTFLLKTSVGCPYQCTFCYALPAVGKKVIYRNLDEVIEEIKLIKEITKGRKVSLNIIDEAFVMDRSRVMAFCGLLRQRRLKVPWVCYGRVNSMDEALLRVMRTAGCVGVYYGIESGSNRVLKKIKKGFTIEEAIRIALLSKKIIPDITASFMYRFPFETTDDFKATISAMRYLKANNIVTQLHPLVPVKSSKIYSTYSNRLKFSPLERCDYIRIKKHAHFTVGSVSSLPKAYRTLIKDYPDVFYDYRYYENEDLGRINRLISESHIF